MHTRSTLAHDLRTLGLGAADVVMVHASVRAVGEISLEGKILLLASGHDNVTYLHYAEHVADFPDKRVARFKVPIIEKGERVWRDMQELDTSGGAHANWPDFFFAKLVDGHLAASGNGGGLVGNAPSHLVSARGLLEFVTPVMIAVAADPAAADDL